MEIVGHRGACGHAPENTLKSFAEAIALGCRRAELDVRVSRDDVAVVMHDATVDRTTNGTGLVEAFTLAELKRLDAGEGEKIPALEEVMNLCRGRIDLQIELKAKNSPPLVARLIDQAWSADKTVVTSFELPLLDEFAQLLPSIALGWLNRNAESDMVTVAIARRHRWICPRVDIVNQELVAKAHASGLSVYAYHVNDAERAEELIRWGVDAAGTDHPEMVARLLSRRRS